MERRRRRNKKKKESKKANKKNKEITTIVLDEEHEEAKAPTENGANIDEKEAENGKINAESDDGALPVDVKLKLKPDKIKSEEKTDDDIVVEIEYVGETPNLDDKDPNFQHFARIFNAFKVSRLNKFETNKIKFLDKIGRGTTKGRTEQTNTV